jgi:hypothetical protein
MAGQGQADLDHGLEVGRIEAQAGAAVEELLVQAVELGAQLALEAQHGAGLVAAAGAEVGVEADTASEHGFLDLAGDDVAGVAEILADLIDLAGDVHEKLEIALELAGQEARTVRASGIALADEVVDVHAGGALAVAVDAAGALLHAAGVPGDLVVDEAGAVVLEVDALGRGVGGEEDARPGDLGTGLEGGLDGLALIGGHAAVEREQAIVGGETLGREQAEQPVLGGAVLGEDDDALGRGGDAVGPGAVRAEGAAQPVDEGARLAVGAAAGALGPGLELVEQGAALS